MATYAVAIFEGADLHRVTANDEWRAEFGDDDREWREAPLIGSWMEWVYRTGSEKYLQETPDRWWGILPHRIRGECRGVFVVVQAKDPDPIPLSDDEARAYRLLRHLGRSGALGMTEPDPEPIPLSGEESIALEALRLLVQRGVIGE